MRWGTLLGLAAGLLVALLVVVVPRLGPFLVLPDEPTPADATFLTYSVNSFARPAARRAALDAAALRYRQGDGPHVLLGAFQSEEAVADRTGYETPSVFAVQQLVKGGVPARAIEVLPAVSSEYEEAQVLRAALAERGWRRVVAYAPDFRSRRTKGALQRALAPIGAEVRVVAVPDPEVPLDRWWGTRRGIAAVANEYPRLLYYLLRGRL